METSVEEELPKRLGFSSTTIIRSKRQIQALVDRDPFGDLDHSEVTNLNVTFLKRKPQTQLRFPHRPANADYRILSLRGQEVYSVVDLTGKSPDVMRWVEKEFGKEITTRTFLTVQRILKRFGSP
jgi:uncharacterized protein (DUF1697 family)